MNVVIVPNLDQKNETQLHILEKKHKVRAFLRSTLKNCIDCGLVNFIIMSDVIPNKVENNLAPCSITFVETDSDSHRYFHLGDEETVPYFLLCVGAVPNKGKLNAIFRAFYGADLNMDDIGVTQTAPKLTEADGVYIFPTAQFQNIYEMFISNTLSKKELNRQFQKSKVDTVIDTKKK